MQYTLRHVPDRVDSALRRRAARAGKSLNDVAIDALAEALGVGGAPPVRRDLRDLAGTWVEDARTERAFEEMREIDEDLWK